MAERPPDASQPSLGVRRRILTEHRHTPITCIMPRRCRSTRRRPSDPLVSAGGQRRSAGLLPAVGLGGITPPLRDRGPAVLSGRHPQGQVGLETRPELPQDQA